MTEMLHIFLSNRPGAVHPGTTGVAVPGYDLRLLDENGTGVELGTPGTLFVRGGSAATGYWSRYDTSRQGSSRANGCAPVTPTRWLEERGFAPGHGDLRRQIRHARTATS